MIGWELLKLLGDNGWRPNLTTNTDWCTCGLDWDDMVTTSCTTSVGFDSDIPWDCFSKVANKIKMKEDKNMATTTAVNTTPTIKYGISSVYYDDAFTAVSCSSEEPKQERVVEPEVKNTISIGDKSIIVSMYNDGYFDRSVTLGVPPVQKFEIIHDKKTQRVAGLITRFADGTYEKAICADSDRTSDGGIDVKQAIMICVFKRMLKCGVDNNTSVMNKLLNKLEKQFYRQMDEDKTKAELEEAKKKTRVKAEEINRKLNAARRNEVREYDIDMIAEAIVRAEKMLSENSHEG